MKKKELASPILLSIILLSLDMITKYFFYNLEKLNSLSIIRPIINTWISFGFKLPLLLVIIISILALFLFFWLFYKKSISWVMVSFLIAWTLWNLIDRITYWWVRDFISIGNFPIFNLADSLLNIWIFLFFIKEFFSWKSEKNKLHHS